MMDWKSAVGKIAPVIGTALGGPLGGAAVSAIANALGLSESTESAVKVALSGMTPEQAALLKRADQEFALAQMREINRAAEAAEKIAADDRASARGREMTLRDRTPSVLAGFVTAGFFGVLGIMLFTSVPDTGRDALLVMLGSLGAAFTGVIAYYFGSSAGSARKTELLR